MEPSVTLTGSALVGALIVPTVAYAKKHWKMARETPLVVFCLVGVLAYGVALLWTWHLTGAWVFDGNVISAAVNNALIAIGFKVGYKQAVRAVEKL